MTPEVYDRACKCIVYQNEEAAPTAFLMYRNIYVVGEEIYLERSAAELALKEHPVGSLEIETIPYYKAYQYLSE